MPEPSDKVEPPASPVKVSVTPGTGSRLGFEQYSIWPDISIGVGVGVGVGVAAPTKTVPAIIGEWIRQKYGKVPAVWNV